MAKEDTKVARVSLEICNPAVFKRYTYLRLEPYQKDGSGVVLGAYAQMDVLTGVIKNLGPSVTRTIGGITILLPNMDDDYLLREVMQTEFVLTADIRNTLFQGSWRCSSPPFTLTLD